MTTHKTIEISIFLTLGVLFAGLETVKAQDDQKILEWVPFFTQAPQGDWTNEPWANACEETSIAMVDIFYDIQLQNSDANKLAYKMEVEGDTLAQSKIILDMMSLKNNTLGLSADETPDMMQAVVDQNLQWYAYAVTNPSIIDLQNQINLGRPVIMPVYGELLYNGQYSYPGPDYHVAVLVGYNDENFIMHDPGTNRGGFIEYPIEMVMDSLESLVNNEFMNTKSVLFTAPNRQEQRFDHLDSKTGQHDLRKIDVIEAAESMYQENIAPTVQLMATVRRLFMSFAQV